MDFFTPGLQPTVGEECVQLYALACSLVVYGPDCQGASCRVLT